MSTRSMAAFVTLTSFSPQCAIPCAEDIVANRGMGYPRSVVTFRASTGADGEGGGPAGAAGHRAAVVVGPPGQRVDQLGRVRRGVADERVTQARRASCVRPRHVLVAAPALDGRVVAREPQPTGQHLPDQQLTDRKSVV